VSPETERRFSFTARAIADWIAYFRPAANRSKRWRHVGLHSYRRRFLLIERLFSTLLEAARAGEIMTRDKPSAPVAGRESAWATNEKKRGADTMRRFGLKLPFLLFIPFTLLALGRPAAAHFVWVDIVDDGGSPLGRVMFGEDAEPGEARLLTKIAQTRAWVRGADGSSAAVKLMSPAAEDQPAVLAARLPAGAVAIEAACDYGVYTRAPGGVRLHYYAKGLAPGTTQSAASKELKMEIVPAMRDGKLTVAVLFDGKPDAGAELIDVGGGAQAGEIKLDAAARAVIEPPKSGRLALRAKHVAAGESGEIGGQRYGQTWYYATLVLSGLATEPAAKETAAAALARARDGRAIWRNFPGFTMDVAASSDDGKLEARATIDASGVVDLSGDRSALHDWALEQLQSLAQHRMPDGEIAEGDVTFVVEPATHPLGRLIDLGDEQRQSRYRLKDDVIWEVNRLMGPQRFTISVLGIHRNDQGKYLPEAFTMSFWDLKTGELKQSLAFWNSWRRVGEFDLPERILEISAGQNGAKTRELTLSNHRLLDRRAPGAGVRP
jgi:hypothetical protein